MVKDEVEQWKADFAQVGTLKGIHIKGHKPETEHIKHIVEYAVQKLMKHQVFLSLGEDTRLNFTSHLIEALEDKGINVFSDKGEIQISEAIAASNLSIIVFSKDYASSESCLAQLSHIKRTRKRILPIFYHVDPSDVRKLRGSFEASFANHGSNGLRQVKQWKDDFAEVGKLKGWHIGGKFDSQLSIAPLHQVVSLIHGLRKIIVASRDKQVLKNGGADKIHEVNKLDEKDSLQLFSTSAFKHLNPAPDFRDLSNKFLEYAQGSPLALKVLGSKLYTKSRKEWESELDKLKEYGQPKISYILRRSFDELDEQEKNIFLDIACFLKGGSKEEVEEILGCLYKGALCGISNLLDKCLLHVTHLGQISMHDMLEDMGKDIVREESKDPGKRSRLWSLKDLNQVLRYNEVNKSVEGIKLNITEIKDLLLSHLGFENMLNLRFIHLYVTYSGYGRSYFLPYLWHEVDTVSLSDELRHLFSDHYPFKYLSSSFNPQNLVVLKLPYGKMKKLWNEDNQDLVNLKVGDLSFCVELKKIPNLSSAINLQSLKCTGVKV
ncbi:hypothetical protein V6N13_055710 [Hibiscus sabdariffa]